MLGALSWYTIVTSCATDLRLIDSQLEMNSASSQAGELRASPMLHDRLVYGCYREVLRNSGGGSSLLGSALAVF